MSAVATRPPPTEDVPGDFDVVAFRFDRLVAAGDPVLAALGLAENLEVDWHLACELLERGATVELALRILR